MSPLPTLLPTVRARVGQLWIGLGYWVRPFDQLADRRRWRWQPSQRRSFSSGAGAVVLDGLVQADVEYRQWREDNPRDAARWDAELKAMRRRLR